MGKLNPVIVNELFEECVQRTGEVGINCDGIVNSVIFDKEKLNAHKIEIYELLKELPTEFMHNGGGGYSFLMACNDKNGNQWTGLHIVIERLFLLGLGIGKVRCLLPRETWAVLPGGVPYYVVE